MGVVLVGGANLLSMLVQEMPAWSSCSLMMSSRLFHWDTMILREREGQMKVRWWGGPYHFSGGLRDLILLTSLSTSQICIT